MSSRKFLPHDWLTDMLFVITDPNIRSAKPRLCQTFTENAVFSSPKYFCQILKCPEFETSMSGACFPDWGPGHRPSWRPPRHLLKAEAPQPRPGPFPPPSAAASSLRRFSPETRRPLWASGGPRRGGRCAEGTTLWAAELYARSTDKRMMNVFGLNSFKLCKAK